MPAKPTDSNKPDPAVPPSDAEKKHTEEKIHRDPATGNSHPIGTGLGAVAAGAAGAAIGGLAGPAGSLIGAALGGISGGIAGRGFAGLVHPSKEEEHWRATYLKRPYALAGTDYEDWGPAYRYGWEAYALFGDRAFEDMEPHLARGWSTYAGHFHSPDEAMDWEQARPATQDAWKRLDERRKQAKAGEEPPKQSE